MADGYAYRRQRMVEGLRAKGIRDERVLAAMAAVPRHLFVPGERRHQAYDDASISIGSEQTISQPLVVALMTEAARVAAESSVLEVGTGSGYQAAILAQLARFVFTVERIPELARTAKRRLDDLGVENVSVKVMDGTLGWRAQGPYDAILVTAAAPDVPTPLVDQLTEGGRMVVPVGDRDRQVLTVVTRRGRSHAVATLTSCSFVPLIGRHGWTPEPR